MLNSLSPNLNNKYTDNIHENVINWIMKSCNVLKGQVYGNNRGKLLDCEPLP